MKVRRRMGLFIVIASLILVGIGFHVNAQDSFEQDVEQPMQNTFYSVINDDGSVEYIKYDNYLPKTIESNDYTVVQVDENDENHVIETYDTYEEAEKKIDNQSRMRTSKAYDIATVADTREIKNGVARIIGYVTYTEYDGTGKGRQGYTHGTSANDAAYIGTFNNGKTIRVKQAGVFMDIPASNVEVTEYNNNSKVSYYLAKNGSFYHYYYVGSYGSTSSLYSTQVGYTPSYLKEGVKYYSYDGHYFYTSYVSMLNDYKTGVNEHGRAINKTNPYYNYYQYLSIRTPTKFSAANFNQFVDNAIKNYSSVDNTSKLKNQGQALLNAQNANGINASLMLGVTINESAWGMSYYAKNRNNLFGIGAIDSNPNAAKYFNSVEECFKYFAYNTLSAGYLYGMDWRYRGSHLGDKLSGINVKYASDPYWGEKAASFSYALNADTKNKDYQKYDIVISKTGVLNFYKDEATKTVIYDSTSTDNTNYYVYEVPATILEISKNSYKVFSDAVLNTNRTAQDSKGYFKLSRDYVYIKKSDVKIRGGNLIHDVPIIEPEPPTYKKGDVNGDGKVTSLDYIQIKNHIMNSKKLTGDSLQRADVNEDGKVTSLDYIKVKNHIMGTNLLFSEED